MHVSLFTVGNHWNINSTTHMTHKHFPLAESKRHFASSVVIKRDILRDAVITDDSLRLFEAEEIHLDYGLC